ncbi:MAG: Na+/H+ antiporter subunit D [Anaerolineae bacterium]|nr:Na+/H+ antiporter subunit D [Anaerolineae bacterium]
MSTLLIAPIVIPFVTGVFSILARRVLRLQRVVTMAGMTALLAVAVMLLSLVWRDGIQVVQVGGWPAPVGITFVADLFSAIMVTLAGLMGLSVVTFSLVNIDRQPVAVAYYPLVCFLLMGVCGAFLTGDIFNLYVWFEVLLISSFVMLGLGGEHDQLQGTLKYVMINLVASTIFLTALGMLYGTVGTLNMADIAVQLREVAQPGIVMALAMLLLVAFGIKSAVFPFYFWLPASYHTPPASVSGIFSGLLTKVGIYALIRTYTLFFNGDVVNVGFTHHTVLLLIAGATMLVGIFGAISQMEMRRILSFNIVSHIGFMVMGLAIFTVEAMTGTVFYIMHHVIVMTNLFLIAGMVRWLRGTTDLKRLGGLLQTNPLVSASFLVAGLALAGIPPLSGFWAKLVLITSGFDAQQFLIVAISLFVSLLTLFSVIKIWSNGFWGSPPERVYHPRNYSRRERIWHLVPIAVLTLITVLIGLSAEPVYTLAQATANQLMNPALYISAVLGS